MYQGSYNEAIQQGATSVEQIANMEPPAPVGAERL